VGFPLPLKPQKKQGISFVIDALCLNSAMKRIFLIGAGRSSSHLIRYLIEHASAENWSLRVGDVDLKSAELKIGGSSSASAFTLDASDKDLRRAEISQSDLVISMLPANLHVEVAKDCIEFGKPVITPSYVAEEMWPLNKEAGERGVLMLNEMGVDPGIDHMSAMRIIDRIRSEGGVIDHFESYTGGLVAPESDDNPWHYKITWNPRNVVLAGSGGTARFKQSGELKFIPYSQLFERIARIDVPEFGTFEGYANRDSLQYAGVYGLNDISTLLRGTLRKAGFCPAWNALIQIGLTDDSFFIEMPRKLTWRDLTAAFSTGSKGPTLEANLTKRFGWSSETLQKLVWLGIFEEQPLGIEQGSPALALQKRIEEKWKLGELDKDLLVMWHYFGFVQNGQPRTMTSWLTTIGEGPVYTAMSRTVGIPIAIAAKHILRGNWNLSGIHLPVIPTIYNPVLDELETFGVTFKESYN